VIYAFRMMDGMHSIFNFFQTAISFDKATWIYKIISAYKQITPTATAPSDLNIFVQLWWDKKKIVGWTIKNWCWIWHLLHPSRKNSHVINILLRLSPRWVNQTSITSLQIANESTDNRTSNWKTQYFIRVFRAQETDNLTVPIWSDKLNSKTRLTCRMH
jgi:hypothetical protein